MICRFCKEEILSSQEKLYHCSTKEHEHLDCIHVREYIENHLELVREYLKIKDN